MMKMLFVFNPNSGKAQIKNQLMKIIQVFSKAGYEITVYPTKAKSFVVPLGIYPIGGFSPLYLRTAATVSLRVPSPPLHVMTLLQTELSLKVLRKERLEERRVHSVVKLYLTDLLLLESAS